jgi:hypothetical protein
LIQFIQFVQFLQSIQFVHVAHVGQIGHVGHVGQSGHIGHVAQAVHDHIHGIHCGQSGQIGHVGQAGHVGHCMPLIDSRIEFPFISIAFKNFQLAGDHHMICKFQLITKSDNVFNVLLASLLRISKKLCTLIHRFVHIILHQLGMFNQFIVFVNGPAALTEIKIEIPKTIPIIRIYVFLILGNKFFVFILIKY